MFTAQQDRAKTTEDGRFPGAPRSPGEDGEFRNLEQTRTTLAENELWLAHNADKILPASRYEFIPTSEYDHDKRAVLVKEDEYVLRCSRIDPIIHDPSAYECRNLGSFAPPMQHQTISVVRTFIDG